MLTKQKKKQGIGVKARSFYPRCVDVTRIDGRGVKNENTLVHWYSKKTKQKPTSVIQSKMFSLSLETYLMLHPLCFTSCKKQASTCSVYILILTTPSTIHTQHGSRR